MMSAEIQGASEVLLAAKKAQDEVEKECEVERERKAE
jgi:hypothetical protein